MKAFTIVDQNTGTLRPTEVPAPPAPADNQVQLALIGTSINPIDPLVAKGYPSIGCAPCTSPVAPGEDPRAGRWRDQSKEECGIHFVNGKVVRTGDKT